MTQDYEARTIALAGMQQSLAQVQQIAWHGDYDATIVDPCLSSLFIEDAESYAAVYGGVEQLQKGLRTLASTLGQDTDKTAMERLRYFATLNVLTKKFLDESNLVTQVSTTLNILHDEIHDLQSQRDYVLQQLARLYQNTISPFRPQLIIHGQASLLTAAHHSNAIRALLLAAVRSIVLWRQAGGTQLNFLLGKSKYLRQIDHLLT
tara:strand:+ start:55958 stop:56575 length:618 start_codon:yes stop_codon:yes gene_type:complete